MSHFSLPRLIRFVFSLLAIISLFFTSSAALGYNSDDPSTSGPCIGGTLTQDTTYSGTLCFDFLIVKTGVTLTIQNATIDVVGVSAANGILSSISLESGAYLNLNNSVIGTLTLWGQTPPIASITITGNAIDFIHIHGGEPAIDRNEIYGSTALYGRTSAVITNNIFYGKGAYISFREPDPSFTVGWDATGSSPVIASNSFLAVQPFTYWPTKFPPAPINIGSNYFGDKTCTIDRVLKPKGDHFDYRCSSIGFTNEKVESGITKKILSLAAPLTSGGFPQKGLHPAEFWVEAGQPLVGQYTLMNNGYPGILMQGVPSLATFSIVTNRQSVNIADVYAELDGVMVRPKVKPNQVTRDSVDCGAPCAIDIPLPAVDKDQASLDVFVVSDSGTVKVSSQTIVYDKPYGRKLTIVLQPVQIMTPFYSHAVPNVSTVKDFLYTTLPALLPLRQTDLNIITMPTETSYTGSFNILATEDTLARGIWNTVDYFSTAKTANGPLDMFIDVVACGNVGQEGGANYRLRRQVIFVEDCKVNALVHEMGHAAGLYNAVEEYTQYSPDGLPVEGATLFNNSPISAINGFNQSGVVHLSSPDSSWNSGSNPWMDIMSAAPEYIWGRQDTLDSFYVWFRSRLGTAPTSLSTAGLLSPAIPPAPGFRRLFLYGETEPYRDIFCMDPVYSDANPLMRYSLKPGTVGIIDLTPLAVNSTPPAALIPPDPFYYCYANYQEPLTAYYIDAHGSPIGSLDFAIEPTVKDRLVNPDYWFATLDVPEAAYRLRIDSPWGESFLNITVQALSTQLTWPPPNQTLSDTLDLAWNSSSSGSLPLRHLLFYRTASTQLWTPLGGVQTGNSFPFSTDILPASDTISLLLLSSNGLRSQTSQVGGLKIANRAPHVTIFTPRTGDIAVPGTAWSLRAIALDPENGPVGGSWTSSIDGVLPAGNLSPVILSPGTHILTYTASDSAGLVSSTAVTVSVANNPTVNLGWLLSDLAVRQSGMDPAVSVVKLTPFLTHTVTLGFQNTGVPVSAVVWLYVRNPLGVETLLFQRAAQAAAFERWYTSITMIPQQKGTYRFRAVLGSVTPVDTDATNNERVWTYSNPVQQTFLPVLFR